VAHTETWLLPVKQLFHAVEHRLVRVDLSVCRRTAVKMPRAMCSKRAVAGMRATMDLTFRDLVHLRYTDTQLEHELDQSLRGRSVPLLRACDILLTLGN
jgi:hypothetical protein